MKRIFLAIIVCACTLAVDAQRIEHTFQDVPMSDALKYLSRQTTSYNINFIYDELEDFRVTTRVHRLSVPDAIRQLVGFYPIDVKVHEPSTDELGNRQPGAIYVECASKAARRYKGRVLDERRQPAEFANIVLLSPTDSTIIGNGVSNASGYFVVPCEARKVIVKVSYVGYATEYRTVTQPNVGNIQLFPSRTTLGNVVIKGERPQYKMAKGGVTVDVQHSLLSKMGTAADVLGQLPRVQVSGTSVQVFAKGTPLIYINNRKLTDNRELIELKSDEIKSVDVITSPGAQYDATVQSVIRIKTIRRKGDGFSLRNDAYAAYNSVWAGYEMAKMTYRTDKLEVFNLLSIDTDVYGEDNNLRNDLHVGDDNISVRQKTDIMMRDNSITENAGMAYAFNDSNSIGASYSFYSSRIPKTFTSMPQDIYRNGELEGTVLNDGMVARFTVPVQSVNLYYVGKLGKLGVDFNSTYYFKKAGESNEFGETSKELDNRDVHSYSNQRNRMQAAKLVLSYPIWKGSLDVGTELSHTHTQGSYRNQENWVRPSETDIRENNLAGFAEYGFNLGHFNISAGLRFEHVAAKYLDGGVLQQDASRTYNNFFPSLSLSWNKGQWSWQLNYNAKTQRPGYNSLRSFIQYDNRYLYEGGNPKLRAQDMHTVELNGMYRWMNLSVGYTYTKNPIEWSAELYENKPIAMLMNRNFDHSGNLYATLSASPKFGIYQPSAEIYFSKQFFDTRKYGSERAIDKPYFQFILRNRFVIPHNWLAVFTVSCRTDSYSGFVINQGSTGLSASLRKSFWNERLIFNLQANDLAKSYRERWTMYGNGVNASKDCYNYTRSVALTVTYNLNVKRSKYKGTGAGNAERRRM